MCYNCGCGLPHDDMGQGHAEVDADGKSITEETFAKLAEKWSMDKHALQEQVLSWLTGKGEDTEKQHYMEHLYQHAADSQGMTVDQAKEEVVKLLKKQLGEK